MKTIESFVENWNSGYFVEPIGGIGLVCGDDHGFAVRDSFVRQYARREQRTQIGISQLGKPAVLLGLFQLGFPMDVVTYPTLFNFHYGDWFESLILSLLEIYGINLTMKQATVQYLGIEGHIDAVIGDEIVLEIKTMSDHNYQKFSKPIDPQKPWFRRFHEDVYGYATQLGCYSSCLNKKGLWLILNKITRELGLVYPNESNLREGCNRARELINALQHIKTLEDLTEWFEAPDPVVEFFRKKPTGYYLVPESMKYSQYADCFYELVQAENNYKRLTTYVNEKYPPEVVVEKLRSRYEYLVGTRHSKD